MKTPNILSVVPQRFSLPLGKKLNLPLPAPSTRMARYSFRFQPKMNERIEWADSKRKTALEEQEEAERELAIINRSYDS